MSSLSFNCVNAEPAFTDSITPASMRTNQQWRGNKKSSQAEKPLQYQSQNKVGMLARWWLWGCMQRCDWPISRYVEMLPTAVSAPAIAAEQQRSNQRQECCFALREFQVLSPETTGVTQELWPLQRLLNILSHLHTKTITTSLSVGLQRPTLLFVFQFPPFVNPVFFFESFYSKVSA